MSELQPIQEQAPFSAVRSLSFAYHSAASLLHNIPDRPGVRFRPVYEENAKTAETLPLNVEEEILDSFVTVICARGVEPTTEHRPYWNRDIEYNSAEVFGTTVQSLDLHDTPLPRTVLPPELDVACFISSIKDRPYPVKLNEQLGIALEITDNDLLGALNICWIGTRFMGRGADQRAYPGITVDAEAIRDWNTQVAQFETYNNSGRNEAPGDNYYFWTHAFAAMAFQNRGIQAKMAQVAFSRGTQIMAFVRKNIATGNQPNITAHDPASNLGRQMGLALAHFSARGFGDKE
jgi:hypothetical protein